MIALTGAAMTAGVLGLGGATRDALTVYAAGLAVAAASSVTGFAAVQWGRCRRPGSLRAVLLALFLGRVTLVVAFGWATRALAPSRLALGLMSLVTFHFALTVLEIALVARPGRIPAGSRIPESTIG